MNAFTLLKADHKKVAGILEKIDATTERGVKTREELFTQLKDRARCACAHRRDNFLSGALRTPKKPTTSRSKLLRSIGW